MAGFCLHFAESQSNWAMNWEVLIWHFWPLTITKKFLNSESFGKTTFRNKDWRKVGIASWFDSSKTFTCCMIEGVKICWIWSKNVDLWVSKSCQTAIKGWLQTQNPDGSFVMTKSSSKVFLVMLSPWKNWDFFFLCQIKVSTPNS